MFDKVKIFTAAGDKTNNDAYGFLGDSAWVIDGTSSSSIGSNNKTHTRSDIQWCANWWSQFIYTHIDKHEKFTDMFEEGANALFNTFNDIELGAIPPSVSVAVVKEVGNTIKIGLLGDCGVLVRFYNDSVMYFQDTTNSMLFEDLIDTVYESKGLMESFLTARRHVGKEFKSLLYGINKKNRFHLLRVTGDSIDDIQTILLQKSNVKSICLISDGMAQYFNIFKIGSASDFMLKAESAEFTKISEEVEKYEQSDLKCDKYKRWKPFDDKTLLSMRVL